MLCNVKGHQAIIHDSFIPRGSKRLAKEDSKPTPIVVVILKDHFIVLDQESTKHEAWLCSICKRNKEVGSFIFGIGYRGAFCHIQYEQHQQALDHNLDTLLDTSRSSRYILRFLHPLFDYIFMGYPPGYIPSHSTQYSLNPFVSNITYFLSL